MNILFPGYLENLFKEKFENTKKELDEFKFFLSNFITNDQDFYQNYEEGSKDLDGF